MTRRQLLRWALVLTPAILGIVISLGPWLRDRYRGRPYRRISLQELGNFPFNELNGTEKDIPDEFRKLDGTRVVVEGMMWDLHRAGPGTMKFQLVYNVQQRPVPLVQNRVFVYATAGQPTHWFDEQVFVRGVLHVHLRRDDQGSVREVYSLTDPLIDVAPAPPPPEISEAWIWGVLCSVLPALVITRHRLARFLIAYSDRRRLRSGMFCRRCGYDLRASTVRCPECGTSFTAPWRFNVPTNHPSPETCDHQIAQRGTP